MKKKQAPGYILTFNRTLQKISYISTCSSFIKNCILFFHSSSSCVCSQYSSITLLTVTKDSSRCPNIVFILDFIDAIPHTHSSDII